MIGSTGKPCGQHDRFEDGYDDSNGGSFFQKRKKSRGQYGKTENRYDGSNGGRFFGSGENRANSMNDHDIFNIIIDPQAYADLPSVTDIFPEVREMKAGFYTQGKTGYCWLMAYLNAFGGCREGKAGRGSFLNAAEDDIDIINLIHADKLLKAENYFDVIEALAADEVHASSGETDGFSQEQGTTEGRPAQNVPGIPSEHKTLRGSSAQKRLNFSSDQKALALSYLNRIAMTDHGQYQMAEYLVRRFGHRRDGEKCTAPLPPTRAVNAALSYVCRWYGFQMLYSPLYGAQQELRRTAFDKMKEILTEVYGSELRESGTWNVPSENPYVSICAREDWACGTVYEIQIDGYRDVRSSFLNVKEETFQYCLDRQLSEEGFCIIGYDAGKFGFPGKGIYTDVCVRERFREEKGGAAEEKKAADPKSVRQRLTRSAVWQSGVGSATHMAVVISRRQYRDGQIYYLIADSKGDGGLDGRYWAVDAEWAQKYVFQAVVNRKYLGAGWKMDGIFCEKIMPWEIF